MRLSGGVSGVGGVTADSRTRGAFPRDQTKNRGHRHCCRWPGRETPSSIGLLSHISLKMAATSTLGASLRRALSLTRRPLGKTHSFSPVLLIGATTAPIFLATLSASRRVMPWCTLGLFRPFPIAREVTSPKRKTGQPPRAATAMLSVVRKSRDSKSTAQQGLLKPPPSLIRQASQRGRRHDRETRCRQPVVAARKWPAKPSRHLRRPGLKHTSAAFFSSQRFGRLFFTAGFSGSWDSRTLPVILYTSHFPRILCMTRSNSQTSQGGSIALRVRNSE
jgi:hypothetical protein